MKIYDGKTPKGRELPPKQPENIAGKCTVRQLTPEERQKYGLNDEINKESEHETS